MEETGKGGAHGNYLMEHYLFNQKKIEEAIRQPFLKENKFNQRRENEGNTNTKMKQLTAGKLLLLAFF